MQMIIMAHTPNVFPPRTPLAARRMLGYRHSSQWSPQSITPLLQYCKGSRLANREASLLQAMNPPRCAPSKTRTCHDSVNPAGQKGQVLAAQRVGEPINQQASKHLRTHASITTCKRLPNSNTPKPSPPQKQTVLVRIGCADITPEPAAAASWQWSAGVTCTRSRHPHSAADAP